MSRGTRTLWVVLIVMLSLLGAGSASFGLTLTRLLRREASVLITLEKLTHRLVHAGRELDDLRHRNQQLRYQVNEASRRIEALEERIAERRHHVRVWTRSLYKLSRGGFIRLLMDRDDGQQLTQGLSATRLILGRDRHEIDLYQRELEQLHRQKDLLGQKQDRLALAETERAEKQKEIVSSRRRQLRLLLSLKRSRGLQEKLAQELDEQQRALVKRITLLSTRAYHAWGFAGLKGKLPRPVGGPIVGVFGRAASQDLGVEVLRHGITIRPVARAKVRSIASGVVRIAGPMKGYGNLVLVEHKDGYFSLYGFLSKVLVEEGDRVKFLGSVGRAGLDPLTGKPALYFELRVKERPLDPAVWLRR